MRNWKVSHSSKWLLLIIFTLLAAGCKTQNHGIGVTEPDPNALEAMQAYSTFELEVIDVPAFLGPVVASNFSVAMAEVGMMPVNAQADTKVILRFVNEPIGYTNRDADALTERINTGSDVHFVAKIVVEMYAPGNQRPIWTGSIQRIHNINDGEYMHMGPASVAFLTAFRELLAN